MDFISAESARVAPAPVEVNSHESRLAMGNHSSKENHSMMQQYQQHAEESFDQRPSEQSSVPTLNVNTAKYRSFPGSAFLEKTFCGSIDTTDPAEYEGTNIANRLLKKADIMCVSSPVHEEEKTFFDDSDDGGRGRGGGRRQINPSSALLARALVSEVTDNPKTMKPAEMAQREYKLLKAQEAAAKREGGSGLSSNPRSSRPVGAPGGIGPPNVLNSFAYACTGDETAGTNLCARPNTAAGSNAVMPPGPMQENRAMAVDGAHDSLPLSPYAVTIGLCMSRRHAVGHPDTVTRQSTYDFNELQDRQYKYVSSTDKYGWRAGGGEKGGPVQVSTSPNNTVEDSSSIPVTSVKEASVDRTHIPIIHIDCQSSEVADQVINALASGDIFIPHMSVQPESLSVQGISPPDLVVRFGCERNDDLPPDEWPNWSLEFMHNQLYEYFYQSGARWMKRPFSITLAGKVRWKTVKHMNRYFSHAERVIDAWREKGPQYLDPQLAYIEGGATPDEVARPHGVYLLRNGIPTNYFAPNFDPPYTTKMTRSLLQNVLDKSWNRKRREWSSEPIPKLVTPGMLMAVACGCADPNPGGYMANQVTRVPSLGAIAPARGSSVVVSNEAIDFEIASSTVNNVTDVMEEKKIEHLEEERDKNPHHNHPRGQVNRAAMRQSSAASQLSEEFEQSVAVSAYAQSVAASNTTVMHTNITKTSSSRGQLDDEWSTSKAESLDPPGEKSTAWYRKKPVARPFDRSSLEKERHQHNHLLARVKQQTIDQRQQLNPEQLESKSSISMDYSADGSSAFLTLDGSSLIGGQYAGDGSVLLGTSASAALASKRHSPKALSRHIEEDEADAASYSLSVQDSASSVQSVVPSDEELFAIGWAKAMDPRSGNFYYFTLDRSKTVWDNPLSHSAESLDGM